MPKIRKDEESQDPMILAQEAWERCSNWPADRIGQHGLAQGLVLASKRFGIAIPDLIARCKELSAFVPTDHDLLRVAAEMTAASRDAAARVQRTPYYLLPEKCDVCHDTGWRQFTRGGYDCAERCPKGCSIPVPPEEICAK